MSNAVLYQEVHRGDSAGFVGGASALWSKIWSGIWLPDVGEGVVLWSHEGDPQDGPENDVKRRTWGSDGTVAIELRPFHLDPSKEMQQIIRNGYRRAWWTERDGDLEEKLRASGWSEL